MVVPEGCIAGELQDDPDKRTIIAYHFNCQKSLKPLLTPFRKSNCQYQSNMVQKMLLLKLSIGLLLIGLPNYQICDFMLLNRGKVTMLAMDKYMEPLCHWTMAAFLKKEACDVYLGTMSGIFALHFKV